MKTTIINLWAGPGAGKSTTAAEVFAALKRKGFVAELVTEYIKSWAWRGICPGPFDDFYITAKQIKREADLYGRVEYIVTDSPVGLGAVYANQQQRPIQLAMARDVRWRAALDGYHHVDCNLIRNKPYESRGRYETEEQARQRDEDVRLLVDQLVGPCHVVKTADDVLAAAGLA